MRQRYRIKTRKSLKKQEFLGFYPYICRHLKRNINEETLRMRTFRLLTFLLAAALVIPSFARKKKDKNDYGVWLAGVAASFTDSLVYITDIQYLDSAYYNTKGLLSQRLPCRRGGVSL